MNDDRNILEKEVSWAYRVRLALEEAPGAGKIKGDCQDLIRLTTGEPELCEVLARWESPSGERVSAGEFINEISDNVELMQCLDKSVILSVVKGYDFKVKRPHSFNLSAATLRDTSFPNWLKSNVLEKTGSPQNFIFEVTEQQMFDLRTLSSILREIEALGCKIALDDFGTGANSLTVLKELAQNVTISMLKIDGSFVQDILENQISETIVVWIVTMANSLGCEVVAEFVESQAIALKLQEISDKVAAIQNRDINLFGQGYAIAKPKPCR